MQWIFITLVASLLWACVNFIDKYLIEKYLKGGEVGALLIFSSLIGVPVIALIYLISPENLFDYPTGEIIAVVVSGLYYIGALIPYFMALSRDDTSSVTPQLLLIPVFAGFLGWLFLGEHLNQVQMVAAGLVLLGSVILSLENFGLSSMKFKKDVLILMIMAAFGAAMSAFLFKFGGLHMPFWTAVFWEHVGFMVFGMLAFSFMSAYRAEFLFLLRNNGIRVLGLNTINETTTLAGNLIFFYALTLAPLALVEVTVASVQQSFVLILGVLLTRFFPGIIIENVERRVLFQKILAIAIMVYGIYLLNTAIV